MEMVLIRSAISDLALNVVLALIALVCAYAVYYIQRAATKVKEQTKQISNASGRKLLEDAIDDVVNLATMSVGAMEQTTAKALREAVKNGEASPDELAYLGRKVFGEVKNAIAPEAQKLITKNLGSFDDFLTKCIEDAVLRIKQPAPALMSAALAGIELSADRAVPGTTAP